MLKLLIADDEPIERAYLEKLFQEQMPEVDWIFQAIHGRQAVELSLIHRPQIIILDVNMPTLDGLSAARIIRQELPDSVILINSAYSEFEFVQQAINDQLDGYLLKPARPEAILEHVRSCLAKRSFSLQPHDTKDASIPSSLWQSLDRVIEATASLDTSLLQEESSTFLNDLTQLSGNLEIQRLFVINAFFRIQQVCYSCSRDLGKDLNDMLLLVSKVSLWQDVIHLAKQFFQKILQTQSSFDMSTELIPKVQFYLEKYFQRDLSLDFLANYFHVSPSHLSRRFSQETGVTISHFIRNLRLKEAERLLINSSIPIATVAKQAGFNNVPHFNRQFRKLHGMSPKEFRNKHEDTP